MEAGYFVPEDLTLSCSARVDRIGGWPLQGFSRRALGSASMPKYLLQPEPAFSPALSAYSLCFPKEDHINRAPVRGLALCEALGDFQVNETETLQGP